MVIGLHSPSQVLGFGKLPDPNNCLLCLHSIQSPLLRQASHKYSVSVSPGFLPYFSCKFASCSACQGVVRVVSLQSTTPSEYSALMMGPTFRGI